MRFLIMLATAAALWATGYTVTGYDDAVRRSTPATEASDVSCSTFTASQSHDKDSGEAVFADRWDFKAIAEGRCN